MKIDTYRSTKNKGQIRLCPIRHESENATAGEHRSGLKKPVAIQDRR
jgi:hypothetical protein